MGVAKYLLLSYGLPDSQLTKECCPRNHWVKTAVSAILGNSHVHKHRHVHSLLTSPLIPQNALVLSWYTVFPAASVCWNRKASVLNSLNSDCSGSSHSPADTGRPPPPPKAPPPSKAHFWESTRKVSCEASRSPSYSQLKGSSVTTRYQLSHQVPIGNYIHSLTSSFPALTHCSQMAIMLPRALPGPVQGRNACFLHSAAHFVTWAPLTLLEPLGKQSQQSPPQPSLHSIQTWSRERDHALFLHGPSYLLSPSMYRPPANTLSSGQQALPRVWPDDQLSRHSETLTPLRPSWNPCSRSELHSAVLLASPQQRLAQAVL